MSLNLLFSTSFIKKHESIKTKFDLNMHNHTLRGFYKTKDRGKSILNFIHSRAILGDIKMTK